MSWLSVLFPLKLVRPKWAQLKPVIPIVLSICSWFHHCLVEFLIVVGTGLLPASPFRPLGSMGPMDPLGPMVPMGPLGPLGPMVSMGPMGPMVVMGPMGPLGPMGPRAHGERKQTRNVHIYIYMYIYIYIYYYMYISAKVGGRPSANCTPLWKSFWGIRWLRM